MTLRQSMGALATTRQQGLWGLSQVSSGSARMVAAIALLGLFELPTNFMSSNEDG